MWFRCNDQPTLLVNLYDLKKIVNVVFRNIVVFILSSFILGSTAKQGILCPFGAQQEVLLE